VVVIRLIVDAGRGATSPDLDVVGREESSFDVVCCPDVAAFEDDDEEDVEIEAHAGYRWRLAATL